MTLVSCCLPPCFSPFRAASPLLIVGLLYTLLQLVQPVDCLQRCHRRNVQLPQRLHHWVLIGEEHRLVGLGCRDAGAELTALQLFQQFLGPVENRARHACQLRHVDAVGAVRPAGHDFVQEDDAPALLYHLQVVVAHRR